MTLSYLCGKAAALVEPIKLRIKEALRCAGDGLVGEGAAADPAFSEERARSRVNHDP